MILETIYIHHLNIQTSDSNICISDYDFHLRYLKASLFINGGSHKFLFLLI